MKRKKVIINFEINYTDKTELKIEDAFKKLNKCKANEFLKELKKEFTKPYVEIDDCVIESYFESELLDIEEEVANGD